jgi:hypothetical protein
MAKQTVNIGVTANDNTGDPLRTSFDKLNDNFDEVYAAGPVGTNIQVSDNTIASTNTNGNIDLDPAGTGKVLVNGPMDANGIVTLNSTVTGNVTPSSNVTYNIGSDSAAYGEIHGNVLHVGSLILREVASQLEIFRTDDSTNAILSGNSTTSGSVLNNGNTVVALTQDGPITFFANNFDQGGSATTTIINTGNITTPSVVATGNVTGGNIVTAGKITDGALISDSGTVTGVVALTASGAITGGTLAGTLSTAAQPNVTSVGTLSALTASGAVQGGSLTDGTATLSSGALASATTVTASGAVTGGSLTDGTATITAGAVTGVTTLTATGNIGSGNVNTTAVAYGSTGVQDRATREIFKTLTSDESAISSTPTNAFGVSPNLVAGKYYEFFAILKYTNSSTGVPTFGFTDDSGDITHFNCHVTTAPHDGAITADTKHFSAPGETLVGSNLNTADDYVAVYHGTVVPNTGGRLDFNLSVDAGTVTPKAGSSFRFTERSASSFGDVA